MSTSARGDRLGAGLFRELAIQYGEAHARRVDFGVLASVVNALRESDDNDLDQLILLAKLEALSLSVTTDRALKETEAIRETS